MFNIKNASKSLITFSTACMLLIGASTSFAQDDAALPVTVVDPATGRVIEAPTLFSAMTEEEKAAYSQEDLKLLEEYEVKMKDGNMTPKPQY